MLTVQEQAIEWLRGQKSMRDDPAFFEAACAFVPTIPLKLAGMPYCPACESVLCGACGHCHGLDLMPSDPECPGDNDDMGRDCAAWYQALNAVWTVQRMSEEQE